MKSFLEKLIKEEVRKIISEEEALTNKKNNDVDDTAFGKYLWAEDEELGMGPEYIGAGAHPPYEANTELEKKFYKIINDYVLSRKGSKFDMAEFAKNVLWPLKQQGKFSEYISPPQGEVYRGLSIVPISTASKILNIPEEELANMAGEPQKIKINSIIKPTAGSMSWTKNINVAKKFAWVDYSEEITYSSFILIADPNENGNDFYLDIDQIAHNYSGFVSNTKKEKETISIGPVKVKEAYIFVSYSRNHLMKLRKKFERLLPKLSRDIIQLSKEVFINLNDDNKDNVKLELNKKIKNLLGDFIKNNNLDFIRNNDLRVIDIVNTIVASRTRLLSDPTPKDINYYLQGKLQEYFLVDLNLIPRKQEEKFSNFVDLEEG